MSSSPKKTNYARILDGCIENFKRDNQLSGKDTDLFEIFSLYQIFKEYNVSYDNIENSIVDGSNDGGIDSILVFLNDELIENEDDLEKEITSYTKCKIYISQCKKEKSFKESAIDKLIATIPELFDLEADENTLLERFNPLLVGKAKFLLQVWEKAFHEKATIEVEYLYVTVADSFTETSAYKAKEDQLCALTCDSFSIDMPSVSFTHINNSLLLNLFRKQKDTSLALEFKERPLSVDYNDSEMCYIGTVLLNDYRKFLTGENNQIRDEIFEGNVRHYQGGNVDVNKRIAESIMHDVKEDFWWLNNGVTIIASGCNERSRTFRLDNPQIVNGLQTSYSIYNNVPHGMEDNRSILVKVIVVNEKESIEKVIESTNRQNPVAQALLRATEEVQHNLETHFLNNGYFYDRRKNFYKNQRKPADKIISIQFAAQSIEAILFKNPHAARTSPAQLFKNNKTYNRIFNKDENFDAYLKCCLINKEVHKLSKSASLIKDKYSYFKLHLSLIATCLLLNKVQINAADLAQVDVSKVKGVFDCATNLLASIAANYAKENEHTNLINIAKSGEFTSYMNIAIANQIAK